MVKANLIRKKPVKPKQAQSKKPTPNQLLTDEVSKVLSKYKNKKYTLPVVDQLVKDLKQVIVRACCMEPTWKDRIAELRSQLLGKALLFKSNPERNDGVLFISNVGIVENKQYDTFGLGGLYAKFNDNGDILDIRQSVWHFPLASTCVRNGKMRVSFERENGCYFIYPILSDDKFKEIRKLAKIVLVEINKQLDEF